MPRLYPASGLKAGQIFSSWTVISFADFRRSRAHYNCRCECGKIRAVAGTDLTSGKSKSCGRSCAKNGPHVSAHLLYPTWVGIKSRCYNPANTGYANYGGRGITVCQQWRDDFWQFAADMGPRPPHHSIDRRDNNGNYCPENCRWADAVTQQNNRRNNRVFTVGGETKTLLEWVNLSGLRYTTVINRMNLSKWTIEKALSEPVRPNRPKVMK